MTGALIILAVTAAIGVVLWAWEKFRAQRHGNSLHHQNNTAPEVKDNDDTALDGNDIKLREKKAESKTAPAVCCGLHAICAGSSTHLTLPTN